MSIPRIGFRKSHLPDLEFDVLNYHDLLARRGTLNHRIDKPHRVGFYHLLFITEGRGTHTIDLEAYPYQKHSLLFISRGQIQSFDIESKAKGVMILFTERFLTKNLMHVDPVSIQRLYNFYLFSPILNLSASDGDAFERIVGDIAGEMNSAEIHLKEEILRLLLELLLLKTSRIQQTNTPPNKSEHLDQFSQFRTLVETNVSETRNAQDYATMLAVSYKHLNTISKNVSGITAKSFIDQHLILESKRRLAITNMPIKELAYALGFDEPTNFVKFFKKHTSLSPAQFRKSIGN